MIDLRDTIDCIRGHLENGSVRSLTYAALECRLAIERICYDRLARVHDYISHNEIRRWPPAHVIKVLEDDVDPFVASTYTLSMSKDPLDDADVDLSELEYIPIGTQEGFDGRLTRKLYHSLANAALHVSIPKDSQSQVKHYGNPERIRKEVEKSLAEIERISGGTLLSTGIGPQVTFDCECGTHNKRRSDLITNGKVVYCINPNCLHSFEVSHEGEETTFVARRVEVECLCGEKAQVPQRQLEQLKRGEIGRMDCSCGSKILFQWRVYTGIQEGGGGELKNGGSHSGIDALPLTTN